MAAVQNTASERVFVARCTEGNCEWSVEHQEQTYVERFAGRHEGANDLAHKVEVRTE